MCVYIGVCVCVYHICIYVYIDTHTYVYICVMHVYMHVSCLCTCVIYMVCVSSILELKDLLSPWCRSAGHVGLLCFSGSVPSSPTVLTARRTLGGSAGAIFHHVLPDIVSDGHFAVPLHPVRQCGIYLCAFPPPTFHICPCRMFLAVWLFAWYSSAWLSWSLWGLWGQASQQLPPLPSVPWDPQSLPGFGALRPIPVTSVHLLPPHYFLGLD